VSDMKIILSTLALVTLVSPVVGHAQAPHSYTRGVESVPPILAFVKADRAGVSEQEKRLQRPIVPPPADTSCSCRRSRGYHTLLGAVTGTLGGAALGAAVGAIYDAHADGGDYMIPGSVILAAYGTVIGLVVGSVVGLAWPTR
jgi:hypothetical protein